MNQAGVDASPKGRVAFLIVAALMLALWGWSVVPPIENWNNPHEDGFSYVGVFYATPICFPIGFVLLHGALVGHGRPAQRARTAMFVGCGVLFIVVAFLIFQYVASSLGGS
jgi:Na+-driven multidrug efflux pump